MRNTDTTAEIISFRKRSPRRFQFDHAKVLAAVDGPLWVTLEGDDRDFIVPPGDEIHLEADTVIVIESLSGDVKAHFQAACLAKATPANRIRILA